MLKFGTWPSPITAELIAQNVKRFGGIEIDEGIVYWEEMRPSEGGRTVVVSEEGDKTPVGYSVCSRVHEYGGKSFTVHSGVIYFVNDKDQCVYVQREGRVDALTEPGMRYGDLVYCAQGLLAVCEKHQGKRVDNFLVLIDLITGKAVPLVSGEDFYSSCAVSRDGKKLVWLSWDLPNMPWDGTTLWIADFEGGALKNRKCVAGGDAESIFQPQWGPDGFLYYISDKSGWWNLYRLKEGKQEALCQKEAEFGLAQWLFGMSTYGFLGDKILCSYFEKGVGKLALLHPVSKELTSLSIEGTHFTQVRAKKDVAAFIKGSPTTALTVVKWNGCETFLAKNAAVNVDAHYLSVPESLKFPSAHGRTAYAYYYAPKNKEHEGPKKEKPPLIIKVHGGPTAQALNILNLGIQFWTSRGFAVLDLNYAGSTGYGRAYRDSLNGQWGIADVEDCEYAVRYLLSRECIDPEKVAITGGSAGGYTTLAALTFRALFKVGASYYGVADPALLAKETHKFESRYLDRLIGPYPEKKELYLERSPLNHVERLTHPIIFFQGIEDKVVPLDQAQEMFDALKQRGIQTELILYPGEKHGFKKRETIIDSLNRELAFYLNVFYSPGYEAC